MRRLIVEPDRWECSLEECPPGFFVHKDQLCFKTEYRSKEGKLEAYNSAGEFFCAESSVLVQPVLHLWEEV